MTNEELRLYRAKLFRDASSMERKPERIPHMSFFVTWKILDAGYKLSEAMNDYGIMEKVVRRHQEEYGFDCILEMGARNAIRIPWPWATVPTTSTMRRERSTMWTNPSANTAS